MAATTIARISITDDSGTGTDGTIWNAAALTSIYDDIDDLFKRTTAGDLTLELENTDTTSTSDTGFIARVGSGAAGDAYYQALNATATWTWGLDNSDSDKFVLAASAALGTTNVLTATSAGVDIPGTLGVTGVATLTAQAVFTGGFKTGAANSYINDDANAKMTLGLTLNQGANDDEILDFKSSDVAHGVTDHMETDSYARFQKASATAGGLLFTGVTEDINAVHVQGIATTATATKSAAATAVLVISSYLKSGTGVASIGANGNMVAFADSGTTRFILDADGDSHQDVGTAWTNFDDHQDVELLHALSVGVSRRGDPLKRAFGRFLTKHRSTLEQARIVTFNKDGHHFINWSRTHMLTIGAVRQLGMKLAQTEKELVAVRRELKRLAA